MSKGTYSHSNRHRMHEKRDEPFVITEARNIGRSFWKEMQAYRQTINELQEENAELKRTLSKSMYALQENAELLKDKERLEWLMKELDEVLYGEVALETREDIDKAMNQSPSIFDDLSDSQRQQICHEHGQPTQ